MVHAMISSTIQDLLSDRNAIIKAFEGIKFVEIIGAAPVRNVGYSASPYLVTIDMAKRCDLFILLLGGRYGLELPNKKSATEVEFDAAYQADPTKILVFEKQVPQTDPKQKRFIKRVTSYYKGYWFIPYESTHDLQRVVLNSFEYWINERVCVGHKLNYFDHFIRIAIQKSPMPTAKVFYKVEEDYIELKYFIFKKVYAIHFEKKELINDFWGCIALLDGYFINWQKSA